MLNLDKSTWNRVKLGDVVKPSKEKVDPSSGDVERYIAGEHMDSDDLKIHRWGEVGDKELGPAFHRKFRPGQVLYGSRRTYLRKVSVADFDGVCANTTFVLETTEKSELLQEFLPFVMTSERFHAFAIGESKGSVNPYVNWSDIAKFKFDLPPLEEQKRIADLLWATERHAQSLIEEAIAAKEARCELVTAHLAELPSKKRLGDLVTIRSGPSYPASNVHDSPVPGTQPVIGITNTRPDGTMDISRVSHVTGLPESTQTIDHSTLILIRTNGNRSRIGNVYLPPKAAEGYAVSAFQFLLKVRDASLRDFIFTILHDREMQSRMSDNASGTTGLGNLGSKWLLNQEVAWSECHSEMDAVVSVGTAARKAEDSLYGERGRLLEMRSSLSSSIFGDS